MAYTPEGAIPPNCGSTLGTFFPLNIFFSLWSLSVSPTLLYSGRYFGHTSTLPHILRPDAVS